MLKYKTIEYKDHTIDISYDDMADSPRDYDNIGTIVAFHRRYTLSDKIVEKMTLEEAKQLVNRRDLIVYPLFMYEHTSVALSLTNKVYPFNDRFDAGQVGLVFCSKEKALYEYHGGKVDKGSRVTKKVRDYIYEQFTSEIELYSNFLNGDVFRFDINGELCNECCSGYFGSEGCKQAIADAKEMIDNEIKHKK